MSAHESQGPDATIGDVARRAGVSVSTVSRAMRALPNVAPATRRRVEEAARELDYHIDRTASRLATGRTETVGVVVPALDTWYFSRVLAGVEAELSARGFDMLLTTVSDGEARHRLASGNAPLRKRVDGLIFVDVLLDDDEVIALERSGLRVVTVGQRTGRFTSVTIDNVAAAREATCHLLELGHRRIGFISAEPAVDLRFCVPGERREGYRGALAAAGVEAQPALEVATGITAEHGAEATRRLLDLRTPPTALVVASDELALGALQATRELGSSVPEDLSVVGFDDRDLSATLGLTTVWQDPVAQGRAAAVALAAPWRDEEVATHDEVAETRLVVRATTAPPSG